MATILYDDRHQNIVYTGINSQQTNSSYHNSTNTILNAGGTASFSFRGSDTLSIVSYKSSTQSGVNVKIDGINYGNFSTYQASGGTLGFKPFTLTGLGTGRHDVVLTALDGGKFLLDAVEVNEFATFAPASNKILIKVNTEYVYYDTTTSQWSSIGTSPTNTDWLNKGTDIVTQAQLEKLSQQAITGRFAVKRL